jgi:hypothetical protein
VPRMALLTLGALVIGCLLGLLIRVDSLAEQLGFPAQSLLPVIQPETQTMSYSEQEQDWEQTLRERKTRLINLDWRMALLETRLRTLEARVQMRLTEVGQGNSMSTESDLGLVNAVDRSETRESPSAESQADVPTITGFLAPTGWFVHVGASQDRSQAKALAQQAQIIIGMPLSVLEVETLGFVVRACGLETQVRAQELVELLLKATGNDQLWIGRGC